MNKQKIRFNKLRTEFLPETLELVERPAAPLGHIIIWMVFVLFVIVVLWACMGQIDEVATARGQVVSVEGVQAVQASGNGIVTEVKVKEGDFVHKGDVLYSMDKEVERKKLDYDEGEMGLLELRIELINEMLEGHDITEYLKGDYSAEQMDVIEAMIAMEETELLSLEQYEIAVQNAKNQYLLSKQNLSGDENKKDYIETQKKQKKKSEQLGSTLAIELELLESNYVHASAEAEKYQKLYKAGAKSKAEWQDKVNTRDSLSKQIEIKKIEIENEKLQSQSEDSSLDYQETEAALAYENQKGAITESEKNYQAAVSNLEAAKHQRNESLYEMKQQYTEQLKQYGVQAAEQYYEYESKDIIAMYDGVIKSLEVDKVGAVVIASQTVAEILPDASQLVVQAQISNSDIGYVEVGQSVDIKVDTYDYQKYGRLSGMVAYISPDAMENERMEKVFKADILIDMDNDNTLDIIQGMECTVEIKTDRRHIIEFFLEPLIDALDGGLKER